MRYWYSLEFIIVIMGLYALFWLCFLVCLLIFFMILIIWFVFCYLLCIFIGCLKAVHLFLSFSFYFWSCFVFSFSSGNVVLLCFSCNYSDINFISCFKYLTWPFACLEVGVHMISDEIYQVCLCQQTCPVII